MENTFDNNWGKALKQRKSAGSTSTNQITIKGNGRNERKSIQAELFRVKLYTRLVLTWLNITENKIWRLEVRWGLITCHSDTSLMFLKPVLGLLEVVNISLDRLVRNFWWDNRCEWGRWWRRRCTYRISPRCISCPGPAGPAWKWTPPLSLLTQGAPTSTSKPPHRPIILLKRNQF